MKLLFALSLFPISIFVGVILGAYAFAVAGFSSMLIISKLDL